MTIREQTGRELALKELEDYRAGKFNASHYDILIMKWGKSRLLEARPDIEPFLHSPDHSLRESALYALTAYFGLQDHWPTAVQFLLYDPDFSVRSEGASALAWLKDNTRDRRTLGILASVVCDPYENEMVIRQAYRSIRTVAVGDSEPLDTSFCLERDADWDLVKASIDPTLEDERRAEAWEVLEQYLAGKVPEQDYHAMLLKFGRAKLQEAREVVEGFLKSETILLQTTALHVLLLYLQVPDKWQRAVDALQHGPWSSHQDIRQHDPQSTYRQEAAFALGLLMRGTRDKATLRILHAFLYDAPVSDEVIDASDNIYFGHHYPCKVDGKEIAAYLVSPDEKTE